MSFRLLSAGAILLLLIASARGAELLAGTATADVTPPAIGSPMGGYSDRKGPSTGIHDRLAARVLVLKSGQEAIAFVSCDLRSFVATRVRERVQRELGIRHLLVSSSHTHSGPLTWEDRKWPAEGKSWYAETEDRLVAAVAEAAGKLAPARIAAGRGAVYLGHNRRRIGPDGRAVMLWRNAERAPTSPVDPIVTVLRVDDATGKPIAIIVHHSCHPSVLGPDNRQISADYPGAMREEVEKQFPGAVCLFWQGAAGDINPYKDKESGEAGFEEARTMGRALAVEAIRVAQKLKTREGDVTLRAMGEVVEVSHRREQKKTIRAGLTAVVLGPDIALIALPGEPFVGHQIALAAKSEVPYTLLLGYTSSTGDEWIGYLPTIEAAVSGGYGAGWNTTVEVGAGEMLVDRGLVRIYELLGKLKEVPTP